MKFRVLFSVINQEARCRTTPLHLIYSARLPAGTSNLIMTALQYFSWCWYTSKYTRPSIINSQNVHQILIIAWIFFQLVFKVKIMKVCECNHLLLQRACVLHVPVHIIHRPLSITVANKWCPPSCQCTHMLHWNPGLLNQSYDGHGTAPRTHAEGSVTSRPASHAPCGRPWGGYCCVAHVFLMHEVNVTN